LKVLSSVDFYSKGNRWDSSCKACISKTKKARRKLKLKRASNCEGKYAVIVEGHPGIAAIQGFGAVFAESVRGLIDAGRFQKTHKPRAESLDSQDSSRLSPSSPESCQKLEAD
jgi:hypothetical protein